MRLPISAVAVSIEFSMSAAFGASTMELSKPGTMLSALAARGPQRRAAAASRTAPMRRLFCTSPPNPNAKSSPDPREAVTGQI
jgi:hypothetical protein